MKVRRKEDADVEASMTEQERRQGGNEKTGIAGNGLERDNVGEADAARLAG